MSELSTGKAALRTIMQRGLPAPLTMAKLSEQEVAKLKETLRGFLNNALHRYPKAGPGILRKLWNEFLEERFGPPPKSRGWLL